MKKSERILAACFTMVVGILLIVMKDDFISILMTLLGVGLLALGVMDLVAHNVPAAVIKIVCGVLVIVCGWVIVRAVLYIVAAALLVFGILLLYDKIKHKVRGFTPFRTVCEYAVPVFYILTGVLLLFHNNAAIEAILIICGALTVLEGAIALYNAVSDR